MIPSAFYSFHLISCSATTFKRPIPAQKWIFKQKGPSNIPKQSKNSAANVQTPSITSPEPLPKQLENPSGAMAKCVRRVHCGPRRDQLLDHGGLAL